jgi:hypothetical protein
MATYYEYDYVKQADGTYKYVLMGKYVIDYTGKITVSMWDGKTASAFSRQPIRGYYYDPNYDPETAGGRPQLTAKYGTLPPGVEGGN